MTLTFSLDIDQLKDMIEEKITYTYLDQHIQTPEINIHKLALLIIILEKTTLPIKTQKQYIIATTLVQIALDTHEHISNSNNNTTENPDNRLSKQLAVLSGDYYSSLYYSLLAESNDIPFIRTLATAIKDVNEYKMDLFFQTSTDIADHITLGKKIESHIILSVAKFVGFTNDLNINIVTELFLLDLLIREKENINVNRTLLYLEHKHTEKQFHAKIDQMIETSIQQITHLLTLNDDQTTRKLIKAFKNISHQYMSFMEEG